MTKNKMLNTVPPTKYIYLYNPWFDTLLPTLALYLNSFCGATCVIKCTLLLLMDKLLSFENGAKLSSDFYKVRRLMMLQKLTEVLENMERGVYPKSFDNHYQLAKIIDYTDEEILDGSFVLDGSGLKVIPFAMASETLERIKEQCSDNKATDMLERELLSVVYVTNGLEHVDVSNNSDKVLRSKVECLLSRARELELDVKNCNVSGNQEDLFLEYCYLENQIRLTEQRKFGSLPYTRFLKALFHFYSTV